MHVWYLNIPIYLYIVSFLSLNSKMMEERTSVVRKIDRMSSIENEPRTLRMDQIHFAREAALYVLQTRPMEEAMKIFTEGLEPVVRGAGTRLGMDLNHDEFEFEFVKHHPQLRDVVTAPF